MQIAELRVKVICNTVRTMKRSITKLIRIERAVSTCGGMNFERKNNPPVRILSSKVSLMMRDHLTLGFCGNTYHNGTNKCFDAFTNIAFGYKQHCSPLAGTLCRQDHCRHCRNEGRT